MRKWLVSGCAAADKKKSGKRNGNSRSFIRMSLKNQLPVTSCKVGVASSALRVWSSEPETRDPKPVTRNPKLATRNITRYLSSAVIRRFSCNFYVMRVALFHACIGNANKLRLLQSFNILRTAISHTRSETTHILINDFT
jgi:hypothetical protein